ncbi:MAG: thiolase family protein [Burkholderiaceae bacterium]
MSTHSFIAGIGATPFGRHVKSNVRSLAASAIAQALGDAACDASALEAVFFANSNQGYIDGIHTLRGQYGLRQVGLRNVPVFNLENSGAGGGTALHLARLYVANGEADIVLAVASEKMSTLDSDVSLCAVDGLWDQIEAEDDLKRVFELGQLVEPPPWIERDNSYPDTLDVHASFGRFYMGKFGVSQRHYAAVAAKNHVHGALNPDAHRRVRYSTAEILAAPFARYPLTAPMCCPISDGAAAVIICNQHGLQKLQGRGSRAVRVLGSTVRTGSNPEWSFENHVVRSAAYDLYAKTSIGPEDIDIAEIFDATAPAEVIQSELLGFFPEGEGALAAAHRETSIGGAIPLNTSGGLLARGHAIAATGLAQVVEVVQQLRGEAGHRQVADARIGLTQTAAGLVGVEPAASCIALFQRG